MLYARTDKQNIGRCQTLLEHSRNVAMIAGYLGQKVGLERTSYLMGYTHDAGKGRGDFQAYIMAPEEQQGRLKGTIVHSRAGALAICKAANLDSRQALEDATAALDEKWRVLTAEILCLAITGHHAGLNDVTGGITSARKSLAEYILENGPERMQDEKALAGFYEEVLSEDQIRVLFNEAVVELSEVLQKSQRKLISSQIQGLDSVLQHVEKKTRMRKAVYAAQSLLAEYLESCLVEADRYDAQCFEESVEPSLERYERTGDWASMTPALEKHIASLESDSRIGRARKKLSDNCAESAKRLDAGIYKCWAPTGFGKTLSSLRFALNQAARLDKRKVFYIIPYTSIIDQTAQIFKEILGEENILEHHCNVQFEESASDALSEHEALIQSWDKPIVLTTMVQFLNTAFSMKNTNIRRLHALTNSVIIFDEIQSLPEHCTYPFFQFCAFLYAVCDCTVVLCSATQPETGDTNLEYQLVANDDIGGLTEADAQNMRRTEIVNDLLHDDLTNSVTGRKIDASELSDIVLVRKERTALIVHNTKGAALKTFQAICQKADPTKYHVHLLTTNLCAKHRKQILATLREELKEGYPQKVIIVSTQLIEAGVDISVEVAYRSYAGLDNVIQTAGRCRRNTDGSTQYPVYVFESADENLNSLISIENARSFYLDAMAWAKNMAQSLMSGKTISHYYEKKNERNSNQANYLGYTLTQGGYDNGNIADAMCSKEADRCPYWSYAKDEFHGEPAVPIITTPYRTISEQFKVIEDGNQVSVFVPYDDVAERAIAVVQDKGAGSERRRAALQTLQQYSVSIFHNQKKPLPEGVYEADGLFYASRSIYNPIIGLLT